MSTMTARNKVVIAAHILLLLYGSDLCAQSNALGTHNLVYEREKILDQAFPRPGAADGTTLVLRFLPSHSAERQVSIVIENEAQFETILAQRSLQDVLEHDPEVRDDSSIVRKMGISAKTRGIEPRVASRLLDDVWLELNRSRVPVKKTEGLIQLDGTKYELWMRIGLMQMHLSVLDEELEVAKMNGSIPIVRLMNKIRLMYQ